MIFSRESNLLTGRQDIDIIYHVMIGKGMFNSLVIGRALKGVSKTRG